VAVTFTRYEYVCNFYLWGNFKQKVCGSSSHILEALGIEIKNLMLEIIMIHLSVKSTVVCLHNETPLWRHLWDCIHHLGTRRVMGQICTVMTLQRGKEPPVYIE